MNDCDRDRLLKNRGYIVRNVDVRGLFTPLIQEGVLTPEDQERVHNGARTMAERCEALLDILPLSGPTAFSAFCRALLPRYRFVLEALGLAPDDIRQLDECDGHFPLRRTNSEDRITSTVPPTYDFADFTMRCAAGKMQEHIELLENVRADRDQLLNQLAEREQDSLELKQVKACQTMLEQSNERLQRERDSALEQLALLRGQCVIINSQYQEARSNVQKLREEVRSQSNGLENNVLRRLCSESSAKFEIEKANHMKTQLELNEVRAKYERIERELGDLRELRHNMASNIEELKGSLRKSEAENLFQRKHTQSLRGDLENMQLNRSSSRSGLSRLHQQLTLLKWQKGQCESKVEDLETETQELREQYDVARREHKQTMDELESKIQELFEVCQERNALVDQFNNLSTYTNDVVSRMNEMEVHCQEANQRWQDLEEECKTLTSRLESAATELDRLRNDFDAANHELAKERHARMEAIRRSMNFEGSVDQKQRENKDLRSQLRSAERSQKVVERQNGELWEVIRLAQIRLDDAKGQICGCIQSQEDGLISAGSQIANKWKLQHSTVKVVVEGTRLAGVKVQWGLLVTSVNLDSPVADSLAPGDRIIQVNGISVSNLPNGCIEDGFLVSPLGSNNDRLTLSVEQPTLPGCDDALAILEQPPLTSYYALETPSQPVSSVRPETSSRFSPEPTSPVGHQSRYSGAPGVSLSTSTSTSSTGSAQNQPSTPVRNDSLDGCQRTANGRKMRAPLVRKLGVSRQQSNESVHPWLPRVRYLKPVRGFTSIGPSPSATGDHHTFPPRSPSPQPFHFSSTLPLPSVRSLPISIRPSVWKQKLNVKVPDESASSSDECSLYQSKYNRSVRHSSLPNILDVPASHRMWRCVDGEVDHGNDVQDPRYLSASIRSPSLKVLHSKTSVLRRGSEVGLSDGPELLPSGNVSSNENGEPFPAELNENRDAKVKPDCEAQLSGSEPSSLNTDQDSGMVDQKDGSCEENIMPETRGRQMSDDTGRRGIRKRSEAVFDRKKQRKRRSATLPDNIFTALPMISPSSHAPMNNPEDWISRMKTPVFLPHLQQPTMSRLKDPACNTVHIHCGLMGDVGICLRGGRGQGLFIQSLIPGSPAAMCGQLQPGDEIIGVNGNDLSMATYEEATLCLKSCKSATQLTIHQHSSQQNSTSDWSVRDAFFVRAKYNYPEGSTGGGMSVFTGDILCVVDTAYNDQIGNWYAYKLSCTGSIVEQGCIPSHQRASQLVCGRLSLTPPTQRRILRLRSSSTDHDRSGGSKIVPGSVITDQYIIGYNVATDAKLHHSVSTGSYICVDKSSFKFPRPIVLLGPAACSVIDCLCKRAMDNGLSFCRPESIPAREGIMADRSEVYTGDGSRVTVDHIAWVADRGVHCLLSELSEDDIRKLSTASLHPIVIYLEPKSTRKLSRILGVKDAHASVLMTFSHREKERLTTSGLLSAKLQSGGRLQKTVTRTAELVKLLQEALRWVPSDVQLQK